MKTHVDAIESAYRAAERYRPRYSARGAKWLGAQDLTLAVASIGMVVVAAGLPLLLWSAWGVDWRAALAASLLAAGFFVLPAALLLESLYLPLLRKWGERLDPTPAPDFMVNNTLEEMGGDQRLREAVQTWLAATGAERFTEYEARLLQRVAKRIPRHRRAA